MKYEWKQNRSELEAMKTAGRIMKIAETVFASTNTPWGVSDYSKVICRGAISYSTGSHGGLCVSSTLASKMSRYCLRQALRFGNGYWYEEDCDEPMALYDLCKNVPGFEQKMKQAFPNMTVEKLEESVKRWHPGYPFEKEEDNGLPKLPPKMKDLKDYDILFFKNSKFYFVGLVNGGCIIRSVTHDYIEHLLKESQYKRSVEKIVRDGKVIFER